MKIEDALGLARAAATWWGLRLLKAPEARASFEAALFVIVVAEIERAQGRSRIELENDYEPNGLLADALEDARIDWRSDRYGFLPAKTRMILFAPNQVGLFLGNVREGRGAAWEDLSCSLARRG